MISKEPKLRAEAGPCPKDDSHHALPGAVLLSDEIEYFATEYNMVDPFNRDNLKAAGIHLCLGSEYSLRGKIHDLYDKPGKNELTIPPFEVAIITTAETINLPRFIIARWNLRVKNVYKGLLWTGALQVDPGWSGKLPCPIYNLSNEDVTLRLGEPIVLMDFVKTTSFVEGKSKEFNKKGKSLRDYGYKLRSALATEAGERIKKAEDRINRIETLTGVLFATIAILFAALSVLVSTGNVRTSEPQGLHWSLIVWPVVSMSLSIVALFFSLLKWQVRKVWQQVVLSFIYIGFAVLFVYLLYPILKMIYSSLLGV